MRGFLRGLWGLLEFIIIIYVIVITSFLLCKNKYGFTQFGDYTFKNIDLMDEKYMQDVKNGDLLVVKNSNDIKNGDIIYYYAVYDEKYIIRSNPVIDIKTDSYNSLYTVDDSGPLAIVGKRVLGKNHTTYANLGSIMRVLESRLGFLFLVLLPVLIVFIYQVYEFVIILRYEKVEPEEKEEEDKKDKKTKKKSKSKKEESKKKDETEKDKEDDEEEDNEEEDNDLEVL